MDNQSHLQRLIGVMTEWVQLCQSVPVAGLPATDKRGQLEKIMWQALKETVEYSKSERAAKNAEERLRVLELLNRAVKAELAVLHEQDAFYVQDFVDELETYARKYREERTGIASWGLTSFA
jgi:hypothetical protein